MAHIAARAGIIAISAAAVAAILIYESPELRRYADDVRRRIATALHQLGDGITPNVRRATPMFNRPEDAHDYVPNRDVSSPQAQNFTHSGAYDGGLNVEADEKTRRRQREELMYWNSLKTQKKRGRKESEAQAEKKSSLESPAAGPSLEKQLQSDNRPGGEKGTQAFKTGAEFHVVQEGVVWRRGGESSHLLASSAMANPFHDDNRVIHDGHHIGASSSVTMLGDEKAATDSMVANHSATSPDVDASTPETDGTMAMVAQQSPVEQPLGDDEFMTASRDEHEQDAYASIQSWAQGSHHQFYPARSTSPIGTMSGPELVSDGQATPAYSGSMVSAGEDAAHDAVSLVEEDMGRTDDVMSVSEGLATPSSWSDVGSVVSENDTDFR